MQDSSRKAEDERRGAIGNIESEQKSYEVIKRNIKQQQLGIGRRVDELNLEIDNTRGSESDILTHKQTIQESESRQRVITEDIKSADTDTKIRAKNKDLKALDDHRTTLLEELGSLNKQADTRAKLAIKRSETTKKEEMIQNL